MNKNNEYKKYFDNVSPDQELVYRTRNMMLSELRAGASSGEIRKISYKKYGLIAVCAAAAAVAIIVSPRIGSSGNNSFNSSVINNSAEVTEVSEKNNSAEITSAVTDKNGMTEVTVTSESTSVSEVSVQMPLTDNKVTGKEHYAVTSDMSVSVTKAPVVSSVPESSAANAVPVITSVKTDETDKPSETVQSDRSEVSVTVIPNFRPGVTSSSEDRGVPEITEPADTPSGDQPDVQDPSYNIDYVDTVNTAINGKEYTVYLNKEYDYSAPHIMDKDSIGKQKAENYFGDDFWPLDEEKSDLRIFVSDIEEPGAGIYFVSGKQTSLSERNSRFAAVSVSDSGTELRYSVPYENEAVPTVIDSYHAVFWQLVQYDDVYICSYTKNGHMYDICFKGYSIDEIAQIIIN